MSTLDKSVSEFLGDTLEQHLSNIKDGAVVEYDTLIPDKGILTFVIMEWVKKTIPRVVNSLYSDYISGHGADNTKLTENRVQSARAAYQRLQFAKPEDYGITATMKEGNLNYIRNIINLLEENASLMNRTAQPTTAIKEHASAMVRNFKESLTTATYEKIVKDLSDLQGMMAEWSERLIQLAEDFGSARYGADILQLALELAPPESKSK